jgi:hypothetical protein
MGVRLVGNSDVKLKSLFSVAEYIHNLWQKIPRTKILNQEATINVPESMVDYSIAVSIPQNLRSIRKSIEITAPSIVRVSASSLYPVPQTVRQATRKVQYDDGRISYVLFPELLPPETELISFNVCYRIDDASLVDDIVERTIAHEPSGVDKNEYWMHAQLKHPKILESRYGRFDLRDVDVTVDVGVHNELKTNIPASFVRRLKTFFEIMSETDPRRQFLAIPRLRKLAIEGTAGSEFKILVDLESLFYPTEFKRFIDILEDFRYSECYKGKEYFELPIEIIPKKVCVISRTDLTLEKPAAEGILIYKRNMFIDEIKSIIEKYQK